ncbi:MAG: RagB/SusD family nutrient uptake outer membrane protein [Bacteroidota bacterium]|nr:RagB/SusD family nutrient uptake outer membrane protein [Bacteroidota bacterium]MDX5429758.1 RagB/SusD family nutrient uptake outer membrane protein [Bacteroidota bacterium]MDX5468537.1 RagB/SusD family nutrient uptake outer membrane protein [Bacteroidota bacterium]
MKKITLYGLLSLVLLGVTSSCNKLLEVTPEGETLVADAIKNKGDLQKLLNSCYDVMANSMNGRTQLFSELLGDNVDQPFNNDDFREIYTRSSNFFNTTIGSLYADFYICVYRVNILNKEVDNLQDLTETDKTQFLAEGSFLRALAHFELVKLWAQPYGYTPDNSHLGIALRREPSQEPISRSTVAETYAYILEDLNFAYANLPEGKLQAYASKDAARALLAKVYFQMNDFENAAKYADEVLSSNRYPLSNAINRFDNDSAASEYIFAFISTSNTDNRAGAFIDNCRSDNNATPQIRLSNELYTLITQRPSDRRNSLVDVANPGTENEFYAITKFNKDYFSLPYLHTTEMKFIRAESLAELNQNLSTAIDDLNEVMDRAYGPGVVNLNPGAQAQEIITAARSERRLEFFCEGDRTHNLKRIGAKEGNVLIRQALWNCNGMVLQFPISETTTGFQLNPEGGCN